MGAEMTRKIILVLGIMVVVVAIEGTEFSSYPSVDIPDLGTVNGLMCQNGAVRKFLGIPYAEPPIGDLRWRPPEEYQQQFPPSGFNASDLPSEHFCTQLGFDGSATGSEDCLYLNIWAPVTHMFVRLPVRVFIHGGGFIGGSALNERMTDVCETARVENVVVVWMNYRLGPLGFLALAELLNENPQRRTTGNYGIQDQRLALQWVQRHIRFFNGDDRRINLSGTSAGAMSVLAHMVMPLSAGLFSSAWADSGAVDATFQPIDLAVRFGNDRFRDTLCPSLHEPAQVLSCLRSQPASSLVELIPEAPAPHEWVLYNKLGPTIDDYELTDRPVNIIRRNRFNRVPFTFGNTAQEGSFWIFPPFGPPLSSSIYDEILSIFARFPAAANISAQYSPAAHTARGPPGTTPADAAKFGAAVDLETDFGFRCQNRRLAEALSSVGVLAYVYEFRGTFGNDWAGSGHGNTMPYMWSGLSGAATGPTQPPSPNDSSEQGGSATGSKGSSDSNQSQNRNQSGDRGRDRNRDWNRPGMVREVSAHTKQGGSSSTSTDPDDSSRNQNRNRNRPGLLRGASTSPHTSYTPTHPTVHVSRATPSGPSPGPAPPANQSQLALAVAFSHSLTQAALSMGRDPSPMGGLPRWLPYQKNQPQIYVFGYGDSIGMEPVGFAGQCEVWDALDEAYWCGEFALCKPS